MKVRVTTLLPHLWHWTPYHVPSPESGDEGENNAEGTNGALEGIGKGWHIDRLLPSLSLTPASSYLYSYKDLGISAGFGPQGLVQLHAARLREAVLHSAS